MPNYIKNRLIINATIEKVVEIFNKYNTPIAAKLALAYSGQIICKKKNTEEFSVGWFNPHTAVFSRREEDDVIGLPLGWEFEVKQGFDYFPDFEKIIPPPNDDAYKDLPNQQQARNSENWWRTWNINNWGTKWNIMEPEKEDYKTFVFDTAWNGVPELMLNLSKQNPNVEFIYEYADEDTGCNCAAYKFLNGEVIEAYEPENLSKEAYELAFKLRPEQKEYYNLVGNNYEYKDNDEDEN